MRLQKPLRLVTYNMHMPDAPWIQQRLAEFDIHLSVIELPYADFSDPNNWLDTDLILSGEALDDNLQMALYEWFFTQRSLRHCMSEEMRAQLDDKLIAAVSLAQQQDRMDAFREMGIYLQQLVLMPLYHH